jgi:hypothetical protein
MNRRAGWLCAIIAAGMLAPAPAFCDGFGFYSWGRGWPTIGVPDFFKSQVPAFQDLKVDLSYDHYALGYLYDGASKRSDRFGWRFNLGVDIPVVSMTGGNVSGLAGSVLPDLSSKLFDALGVGFTAKLAYGIGVFHTDKMRVWVGPSARLTADYLIQGTTSLEQGGLLYEATPWGVSLSVGGGAEAGIRYDLCTEVSVDFSTGFHYNFFGYYQDARLKIGGKPAASGTSFLIGQEPFVFLQLALRFNQFND